MAASGPKQKKFSKRQINNFIKLCLSKVDFNRPGLAREAGLKDVKAYLKNIVLPELKELNFSIEDFANIPEKGETKELHLALEGLEQVGVTKGESHKQPNGYHVGFIDFFKELTRESLGFGKSKSGQSLQKTALRQIAYFKGSFQYKKPEAGKYLEQDIVDRKAFNEKALLFFIDSIKYLLSKDEIDLAETLHNSLHIGYLVANQFVELDGQKSTMELSEVSKKIGLMITDSVFFTPFALKGKIVPQDKKHEIFLAAELISVCLRSEFFAVAFSQDLEYYKSIKPAAHVVWPLSKNKNKTKKSELREAEPALEIVSESSSSSLDDPYSSSPLYFESQSGHSDIFLNLPTKEEAPNCNNALFFSRAILGSELKDAQVKQKESNHDNTAFKCHGRKVEKTVNFFIEEKSENAPNILPVDSASGQGVVRVQVENSLVSKFSCIKLEPSPASDKELIPTGLVPRGIIPKNPPTPSFVPPLNNMPERSIPEILRPRHDKEAERGLPEKKSPQEIQQKSPRGEIKSTLRIKSPRK